MQSGRIEQLRVAETRQEKNQRGEAKNRMEKTE